ncbi:hypothetical protein [Streptomyces sp. NPDC059649]|uniref:hypothetical protein n=1 Tax=Streptomyces sp. NPDC059649 TaxID=3346895 RepID=UPI00368CCE89
MTHRQNTRETAASRPQTTEQPAGGPPVADTREQPPDGHTAARLIRQLRAERDLLARTVAVYTMRSTADVLAETREALNDLETNR